MDLIKLWRSNFRNTSDMNAFPFARNPNMQLIERWSVSKVHREQKLRLHHQMQNNLVC